MRKRPLKHLPTAARRPYLHQSGQVDPATFIRRFSLFLIPFTGLCYTLGRVTAPIPDTLDQRFQADTSRNVAYEARQDQAQRTHTITPFGYSASPTSATIAQPPKTQQPRVTEKARPASLSQACQELTQTTNPTENLLGAIDSSEPECVTAMIDQGGDLHHVDEDGNTLLHHAVETGNPEVVQQLLSKGLNVNALNRDGVSALQMAIEQGQPDSVKKILDASADLNLKNSEGETPLDIAKTIADGAQDEQATLIVQNLLQRGARSGHPESENPGQETYDPTASIPLESGVSITDPAQPSS